jgi:hypothetical protein
MSVIPLDLQAKIANWRLRATEGVLTLDEMRDAIVFLRAGRLNAATASKKTPKVAPDQSSMLGELEGL